MALRLNKSLWYASRAKLDALETGDVKIARLSAKIGWPGVGEIAAEAEQDTPKLQKRIAKLEKKLTRSSNLVKAADLETGRPPPYFEFEGPSARQVSRSVLFVAVVSEPVAVLLVGSAENAIGIEVDLGIDHQGLATRDPYGMIRSLVNFICAEPDERSGADDLERSPIGFEANFTWGYCIEQQGVAYEDMPYTRGIALYAGRSTFQARVDETLNKALPPLRTLVVGTPIWVEQV